MTYEDVKRIRDNPSLTDVDNEELAMMIDEAIEFRIPKKLNDIELTYSEELLEDGFGNSAIMEIVNVYGKCPSCGFGQEHNLTKRMYHHPTEADKKVLREYCWLCGQAINWSDEQ